MIFGQIDQRRFEALAGYARQPEITLISRELSGYASKDERLLGMVLLDLIDNDYSWVMFGRDEMLRYRAIDVRTSLSSIDEAHVSLFEAMASAHDQHDLTYYQGDASGAPVDFLSPLLAEERLNPTFKTLIQEERYTPAREIIRAMMRYHQDMDGVFIRNFQAAGFDARLWELYLWAAFTELGFVRCGDAQTPDFMIRSLSGRLAVEATTANRPDGSDLLLPKNKDEFIDYVSNYLPIRLSIALKNKLNRKPPYWEELDADDIPFCIAVQDFSGPGSMRFIASAAIEYAYGVRHSLIDGELKVEHIKVHRYGKQRAQSGFFKIGGAENVSAIIVNPQGTITKFNRLGFIAGFGNPGVRMVRSGYYRDDGNAVDPRPKPFFDKVDGNYQETWVEGMVVIHNPNARIRLDPALVPGAAHEFLLEDGSIRSQLPNFHPLYSQTSIQVA